MFKHYFPESNTIHASPGLPFYWRIFFNFHKFNISLMPYLSQIFKKGLSRRIRYAKNYIGSSRISLLLGQENKDTVIDKKFLRLAFLPSVDKGDYISKMLTLDPLYSGWCCSTLYKLDQVWRGECVWAGCLGSRQYCWRWS